MLGLFFIFDFSLAFVSSCETSNQQQAAQCAEKGYGITESFTYRAFAWFESWIGLHEHFIIAGATIAIAVFTLALWRSTDKLWAAGERQYQLTRGMALNQQTQTQESNQIARESAEAATRASKAALDQVKHAELTTRTLLESERAHVFVEIESTNIPEIIRDIAGGKEKDAKKIAVTFIVENIGKTPAIIWDCSYSLVQATDVKEVQGKIRPLPSKHILAGGTTTAKIICPYEDELSKETAALIQSGKSSIFFFGHIRYSDILDRHMDREFKFRFSEEKSFRMRNAEVMVGK
jgi:hypothetical protein